MNRVPWCESRLGAKRIAEETRQSAALSVALSVRHNMTIAQPPTHEVSADRADTHPVLAKSSDTAEAVRQQVRQQGRTDWELICVIDDDGCLLGTLTAAELLVLPDDTALGGIRRAATRRCGDAGAGRRKHRGLGARATAAVVAGSHRVRSGVRQRAAGNDRAGRTANWCWVKDQAA